MSIDWFSRAVRQSPNTRALLTLLARHSLQAVKPPSNVFHQDAWEKVRSEACKILKSPIEPASDRSCELSDAELVELAALAKLGCRMFGLGYTAGALLSAVDDSLRESLFRAFDAFDAPREINEGEPFPIAFHDLRILLGKRHFSTAPHWRENPYNRRRYLGVLPPGIRYRIVFDFRGMLPLERLRRNSKIAAVLPNSEGKEMTLDVDDERRRFFNVRPASSDWQSAKIRALLEYVDTAGAFAALLPELSVTRGIAAGVGEWVCDSARSVKVAAIGSYHVRLDEGDNRNRLELHGLHGAAGTHDKFNAFELRRWREQEYDPPLREDIAGDSTIVVHWCGGWSLTTLICKDLLEPSAVATLSILRPNFVFVVAYSDDTSALLRNARHVSEVCQAVVVLCNFTGGAPRATASGDDDVAEPASAILALPVKDKAAFERPILSGCHGPATAIVDLQKPEKGWSISSLQLPTNS